MSTRNIRRQLSKWTIIVVINDDAWELIYPFFVQLRGYLCGSRQNRNTFAIGSVEFNICMEFLDEELFSFVIRRASHYYN